MDDSTSRLRIQKKILLKLDLVSEEAIEECVTLKEKIDEETNISLPLPSILFHRERISEGDLREFHEFFKENFSHLSPSMPVPLQYKFLTGYTEGKLEQIVLDSGQISKEELEEAKQIRDHLLEKNIFIRTGEILIHSGQVDPGTLRFKLLQNKISELETGEEQRSPDGDQSNTEERDAEDRLGDIAVEHQFISEKQLDQALSLQTQFQEKGIEVALGEMLISLKFITKEELKDLLKLQQVLREDEIREVMDFFQSDVPDRPESKYLGNLAVKEDLLEQEQLEECLELQEQLQEFDIERKIGEILLEKNYLSEENLRILLEMQSEEMDQKPSSVHTAEEPSSEEQRQTIKGDQPEFHAGSVEELVPEIIRQELEELNQKDIMEHPDEEVLTNMVENEIIRIEEVSEIVRHAIEDQSWHQNRSPVRNAILDRNICNESDLKERISRITRDFSPEQKPSSPVSQNLVRMGISAFVGVIALGSILFFSFDNTSESPPDNTQQQEDNSKNPVSGQSLQSSSSEETENPTRNTQRHEAESNTPENESPGFRTSSSSYRVILKKKLPATLKGPFPLNFTFHYGLKKLYNSDISPAWLSDRRYKIKFGLGKQRGLLPPGYYIIKGSFRKAPVTMPTNLIIAGETYLDKPLQELLTGQYWYFHFLHQLGSRREITSFRWKMVKMLRKLGQSLKRAVKTWQSFDNRIRNKPELLQDTSSVEEIRNQIEETVRRIKKSFDQLDSRYFIVPYKKQRKRMKKLAATLKHHSLMRIRNRMKEIGLTPPQWLRSYNTSAGGFSSEISKGFHKNPSRSLQRVMDSLPETKKSISPFDRLPELLQQKARELIQLERLFCKLRNKRILQHASFSSREENSGKRFQRYFTRIYKVSKAMISLQKPLFAKSDRLLASDQSAAYKKLSDLLSKRVKHLSRKIFQEQNVPLPSWLQGDPWTKSMEQQWQQTLDTINLRKFSCKQ